MLYEAQMPKSGKVVIRKYPNRRLYDTSGSRYVNLEDIAALIRDGADIQVIDEKTGRDITRVTLTQIILEDARNEPAGPPLELLRDLIVTSDTVRKEFMRSAVDAYSKLHGALQSGISGVRDAALSPLQAVSGLIPGTRESGEVEELRNRVAQLEARLQIPKQKKRKQR
jgi:polyhydroxyalkanoate synthesis repressor PhaR